MFRIDKYNIVDATVIGSLARYINHSCSPNCYTKIIQDGGKKKICIYSLREIKIGEELTYNYNFPKEEVKIPCFCGAKNCAGWMN